MLLTILIRTKCSKFGKSSILVPSNTGIGNCEKLLARLVDSGLYNWWNRNEFWNSWRKQVIFPSWISLSFWGFLVVRIHTNSSPLAHLLISSGIEVTELSSLKASQLKILSSSFGERSLDGCYEISEFVSLIHESSETIVRLLIPVVVSANKLLVTGFFLLFLGILRHVDMYEPDRASK